jgi:hypothetical protein
MAIKIVLSFRVSDFEHLFLCASTNVLSYGYCQHRNTSARDYLFVKCDDEMAMADGDKQMLTMSDESEAVVVKQHNVSSYLFFRLSPTYTHRYYHHDILHR